MKTFVAIKFVFIVRSESLDVKIESHQKVVVRNLAHGAESRVKKMSERHKPNFMDVKVRAK